MGEFFANIPGPMMGLIIVGVIAVISWGSKMSNMRQGMNRQQGGGMNGMHGGGMHGGMHGGGMNNHNNNNNNNYRNY